MNIAYMYLVLLCILFYKCLSISDSERRFSSPVNVIANTAMYVLKVEPASAKRKFSNVDCLSSFYKFSKTFIDQIIILSCTSFRNFCLCKCICIGQNIKSRKRPSVRPSGDCGQECDVIYGPIFTKFGT